MSTKPKVANISATVEVQLTLRVKVDSTWSGDCTTEQIFRQGREEAVKMINIALYRDNEKLRHRVAIVGTPDIRTVIGVRT